MSLITNMTEFFINGFSLRFKKLRRTQCSRLVRHNFSNGGKLAMTFWLPIVIPSLRGDPLIKLKILITAFLLLTNYGWAGTHSTILTLMIDPAGDAKHAGRIIDDSFERGVTLQIAEQLKHLIEQELPTVRVILTRFPGEFLEPLQNAHFANRLEVDFYLSIHCYQEREIKSECHLFYFLGNITDEWQQRSTNLHFQYYDKAHIPQLKTSKKCARIIQEGLQEKACQSFFGMKGILGIPFKPLIGILSPAVAIELSLPKKDHYKHYLIPLKNSIINVLNYLKAHE